MAPRTRIGTLYRLVGIPRTVDALLDVLDSERLKQPGFHLDLPEIPGATAAIMVSGHFERDVAEWCRDASSITGLDLRLDDKKSAGALVVIVDDNVYAIGFGQGYRLIPDEHKDPTFGLKVAVRSVNPDRIQEAVRRSMVNLGRTDATFSADGLPIDRVGISEYADIVRKLSGRLSSVDLAIGGDRVVRIHGAAGLRLPIPTDPDQLVACIRAIAEVCDTKPPHERLAFIEEIQPVGDRGLLGRLDEMLEQVLGQTTTAPIAPIVPVELLDRLDETHSYNIEIGGATIRGRADLHLDDILQRCFIQPPGMRTTALHNGHIELCGAADGSDVLGSAPAIHWLETSLSIGPRRFFLMDGEWYEIGAGFLAAIRRQVESYIAAVPSLDLLDWEQDEDGKIIYERHYNLRVQHERGRRRYLCLDRKGVRDELHKHNNGFEACDLLGPDNEFIMVKPASSSAPLSHLFAQALNSVSTLFTSPTARQRFAAIVEDVSDGERRVSDDFCPKKVVFAILLKKGEDLTVDTLFPFSQVTLVHVAKVLQTQYSIEIEVIGIHAATS